MALAGLANSLLDNQTENMDVSEKNLARGYERTYPCLDEQVFRDLPIDGVLENAEVGLEIVQQNHAKRDFGMIFHKQDCSSGF